MEVIDDLCNLVHENSYNKCRFCIMPTESLVLSVLQMLLDASQKNDKKKESSPDICDASVDKGIPKGEDHHRHTKRCSSESASNLKRHRSTRADNFGGVAEINIDDVQKSSDTTKFRNDCSNMRGNVIVLDTPIVRAQGNGQSDDLAILTEHAYGRDNPIKHRVLMNSIQQPRIDLLKVFEAVKDVKQRAKGATDVCIWRR